MPKVKTTYAYTCKHQSIVKEVPDEFVESITD